MSQSTIDSTVVNIEILTKLLNHVSGTTYLELANSFFEEMTNTLENIYDLPIAQQKDLFHKHKGTAYTLAMQKLGEECYICESTVSGWNLEEYPQNLASLENILIQTKVSVKNLLLLNKTKYVG